MAEITQIDRSEHRHRRRRKRRKWRRRLILFGLVVVLFAVWGFAVVWYTEYLGRKEQLGEKYHDINPLFRRNQ